MSQDLDELYEISDRLVVICAGRLSAPRQTRRADRGEIGMLMAGVGMKGARECGSRLSAAPSARSLMALASPLLAIALTLATGAALFALLGKPPIEALKIYFFDPLHRSLGAAGNRREGDAAGADRRRPVALLSGERLEHRRRGPVPDRRDHRRLARGQDARHGRRLLGAARDAGARCARRRALRADPGAVQGALRRERNSHQPDAGLCRRTVARLSGARAVARSEGLQFPDHGGIRSRRLDADPDRGQPPASRRDHRAAGGASARRSCSAAR